MPEIDTRNPDPVKVLDEAKVDATVPPTPVVRVTVSAVIVSRMLTGDLAAASSSGNTISVRRPSVQARAPCSRYW